MSHHFIPMFLLPLASVATLPVVAQIIPDGTLPANSVVTPEGNRLTIDGGTTAGGNLFHSFDRFDVPTGFEAFFNNAPNIENIFGRVTGDGISEIDGILRANGQANLFLLNPNGIIFGANAQLDLGGSFFASTAESLVFEDGSIWSATSPGSAPLLTVSVPVGLQFGSTPGAIRVEGSGHNISQFSILSPFTLEASDVGLQVRPGNTLALLGGDLSLSGGILSAESGQIELRSIAGGQLSFSQESEQWTIADNSPISDWGEIHLQEAALVDVSGDPGGSIEVRGGRVTIEGGALIFSEHRGAHSAGSIRVRASESIEVSGTTPDSRIRSSIGNQNLGAGRGSDIEITTPQLTVSDGGLIATSAFEIGTVGNITIDVSGSIDLIGFAPRNPALTSGISTSAFMTARSGDIDLSTGRLRLIDGGNISSSTLGTGRGGNIIVNATESIEIIGVEPILLTPSTINAPTLGAGDGGNAIVNVPRLSLRNGGRVGSSTLGSGAAGTVTIEASEFVEVSGTVPNSGNPSQIDSSATQVDLNFQFLFGLPPLPSGDSGNVTVRAPVVRVFDGGLLSVKNDGFGNAGTLSVITDEIQLDNRGGIVATTQSGEGGNLDLQAIDTLQLRRQSQISATAGGTGNGGNIAIETSSLLALENSDISANAGQGTGGRVRIAAQGLFGTAFREMTTPESDITATSERGVEFNGVVEIQTPDVDRETGLVKLPQDTTDPTDRISEGCAVDRGDRFVVLGRGGLPEDPTAALRETSTWSDARDWRNLSQTQETIAMPNSERFPFIEASGWVRRVDGTIELVATSSGGGWHQDPHCKTRNPSD